MPKENEKGFCLSISLNITGRANNWDESKIHCVRFSMVNSW